MSTKRRLSDGEGYKARARKAVKSISGLRRMYAKDLLLAKKRVKITVIIFEIKKCQRKEDGQTVKDIKLEP